MTDGSAPGGARTGRGRIWLQLAVGYFLVLRLAYALVVPPNADEAYYWLWGQHLQLSYLDHSPLVGWSAWLVSLLIGWSPLALHLPALLSFAILAWALRGWTARVWPDNATDTFWLALAIFSASPILFALTTLNYPDYWLVCFAALAMMRLGMYLGDEGAARDGRLRDLYLGALFLGLAGLSKYSAALVGIGLVLAVVLSPRLRHLLRQRHFYLAAGLTLLVLLPVIWWNIDNHFLTLRLHTQDRFDTAHGMVLPLGAVRLLLLTGLELSPFLIWGLLVLVFGRTQAGAVGGVQSIGRWTAILTLAGGVALASWSAATAQVSPHWLVVAFIPLALVAPAFIRSRWIVALHIGWGAALLGLVTLYYLSAPLLADALGYRDQEAAQTFGQDQLAAAARAEGERLGISGFAAPDYERASKLAFGLGSGDNVYSLSRGTDQFDFWVNYPALTGTDMIVVDGENAKAARYLGWFDSVETLAPVMTSRFGRPLATYQMFVGRGFRPRETTAE